MITQIEQLPIEIWLTIFRYFETHDLFQSFQNLNSYFNQILSSNHILFYLQLREIDNNHLQYPIDSRWSDFVLNHVIYLQSSNQDDYDYFPQFLRWHAKKLIRLQSLFIRIYQRNIPYICVAFKELYLLRNLSMKCIPNQILLEAILDLPNLRICQLLLREIIVNVDYSSDKQSNIEQLSIVFYYNINHSVINLFLIRLSKLKRLKICGSYSKTDKVSLFAEKLFILPELRILKLKLENGHFTSDCFKYLHNIMPSLKYFNFNYYNHYLHDAFITYLITQWWTILKYIQRINIYIKGHIPMDNTDVDKETILEKDRDALFAKNKEPVKVEWIEQILTGFKVIEITIIKS